MLRCVTLNEENLLSVIEKFKNRAPREEEKVELLVKNIINEVKKNGDEAVKEFTLRYDDISLENFEVTKEELEEAAKSVEEDVISALREAAKNITFYHEKQKSKGYMMEKENGIFLGQRVLPLERVGVYVPGGTAAYPSTVLMNVIPAKVAGVSEIVMITPPGKDGKINKYIAQAALILGIDKVFTVGGAQGIAALAYGTESIPKVDKIVGPGNIFVATAKKCVYGQVDIDSIAGPSEILVLCDENANAKHVAADLLSQGEHDVLASSILVTTSKKFYEKVCVELREQTNLLERKEIIEKSLKNYGMAFICETLEQGIEISNMFAPEHLELMVKNPMELLGKVKNAGSVFLGYNTPEAVGDYFGGTNHVLPTGSTARFFSPLSVDSFVKKSSYLYYSEEALKLHGEKIILLSEKEGLTAHGNSIRVRIGKKDD
ncbi:MAG: histidinol dehydrogenase [Clostridium perfringens]|nr:histidinol dehydrogenase [Clostridium perfringens]